jgi:hypothetical protein
MSRVAEDPPSTAQFSGEQTASWEEEEEASSFPAAM